MCEHGEGHVISHHSKCFSSKCASMMVHGTFIHSSYFEVITIVLLCIDSVYVPLNDVQGLITCSSSARAC